MVSRGRLRSARDGVSFARSQVDEIQRARVLAAASEVVAERGAGGATVAHIVARAGVSRRTFYELFADREDCFLAAFDQAVERATARVVPAFAAEARWRERVRAALIAGLVFLDEDPELGALCIVHALGAGPRALERRAEVVRALVDGVHEGGREARRGDPPERLVAEGVVGAVLAVLHTRLSEHGREPLTGLAGPLMAMVVLPYMGTAAAERERLRPAPRDVVSAKRRGAVCEDPLKGLDMRLTYRTVRVLLAIAQAPGASNRRVGDDAGIVDQGQTSKLLQRLKHLGLIENAGSDNAGKGEPNAWWLTVRGEQLQRTIHAQAADEPARVDEPAVDGSAHAGGATSVGEDR
jgi:AcrR family transcriptional regulator/DNA-binding MarR family transcriptional regulator